MALRHRHVDPANARLCWSIAVPIRWCVAQIRDRCYALLRELNDTVTNDVCSNCKIRVDPVKKVIVSPEWDKSPASLI